MIFIFSLKINAYIKLENKILIKCKNKRRKIGSVRKLKHCLICMLNTRDGSPKVFLCCVFYGTGRQLKPVLSNWISKAWEHFQFRKCDCSAASWNCVLASHFWLGYEESLYASWNVPNNFYYCCSIPFICSAVEDFAFKHDKSYFEPT